MAENGATDDERGLGRMRDFIFSRELAEVYLLLDHVSGRPDKSLATASTDADKASGKGWIEQICEIGWPPPAQAVEKAAQAAILLRAKDRLNSLAYPANGATIAFTVLVAGEEAEGKGRRGQNIWQRLKALLRLDSHSSHGSASDPRSSPRDQQPGDNKEQLGRSSSDPAGHPPTRTSLARVAYPGLWGSARRFKRKIVFLIGLLVVWLIFTCALSWNITAGHAILTRIDAVRAQRADLVKKINDVENEEAKSAAGFAASSAAAVPVSADKRTIVPYCERVTRQPAATTTEKGAAKPTLLYESVTQHQICDQLDANTNLYQMSRDDLNDWLAMWSRVKEMSYWLATSKYIKDVDEEKKKRSERPTTWADAPGATNEQWASILVEVLAGAVLPLCYGFLGAGAAVVRSLWGKMRDSLLSPRDWTLAVGQLALGAVIGACIGLFVAPAGSAGQTTGGLTTSVPLSASALSFIAGFGVEGVFVAMESLIKRVFNISDSGTARASQ